MGAHWELKGTCWEQMKNEENPTPTPQHPKLKRKKIKALSVHAEPSHWLHEIFISKTVCHHFWPGVLIKLKNCSTWTQRP
jgi:hypothetical protein